MTFSVFKSFFYSFFYFKSKHLRILLREATLCIKILYEYGPSVLTSVKMQSHLSEILLVKLIRSFAQMQGVPCPKKRSLMQISLIFKLVTEFVVLTNRKLLGFNVLI